MKAILEFNLDEPEDKKNLDRARKSLDLCLALLDIDNMLRTLVKYPEDTVTEHDLEVIQKIRGDINEIIRDHGINLDDLVE